MKEKIKVIIELQNCDNRIRKTEKMKAEAPLRIQALSDEIELVSREFQEENQRLDAVSSEKRELEVEVDELEGKIRKSNEKLSNIKSNKEYTAALKEIEALSEKKTLLEDRILQYIEETDLVSESCGRNREQLETLKKSFELERRETQEKLKDLQKELEEMARERSAISSDADPVLLKHYQFLRERLGPHAISPVIGGICRTCNMGIPPQMFNELMKCRELTTCPHCNRIIYWGEDLAFQGLTNEVSGLS